MSIKQIVSQAFSALPLPRIFGRDVVVTPAGNLSAKSVYHAAFRAYRDENSLKVHDSTFVCRMKHDEQNYDVFLLQPCDISINFLII